VGGVPTPDADNALPAVVAKYTSPQRRALGDTHGLTAVTYHKQLETYPQQPTGSRDNGPDKCHGQLVARSSIYDLM